MAHNLEIRNGVASFAYAIRENVRLPWHGLGQSHNGLMVIGEALSLSRVGGLIVSKYENRLNGRRTGTFGIQRHDVLTTCAPRPCEGIDCEACDGEGCDGLPCAYCAGAGCDPATLGLPTPMDGVSVGSDYSVIQFGDTARNFCNAAFGTDSRVVDTMGVLGAGERMFTTFLGETTDIRPGDPITSYNILSTSHDGTGAVLWFGSDTRVVCQNTLRIALANMRNTVSIRHTKNAQPNVNAACKALADAVALRAKRVEAFKVMGNRDVTVGEFKMFLDALYPVKRDGEGKEETGGKTVAKRERLTALFEGAATGSRLAGKTAWGVFQAVTQDADETARGAHRGSRLS